jgi:flavorubredoxin
VLDRIKSGITQELAAGKLYALQNTMRLDGRVSSYPASARGYSVTNCYLLKQPDAAWLIDTGFGGDEASLRAQIESLFPRTLPLSLLPLRLNEFMSIQNIDPFTLYFNVKECFTGNPDAAFWFDFGAGSDSGQNTLDRLNITTISREETIPIGAQGRPVVVYQAPIRLIATRWIYDAATKTLFTSDMWTHTWRETPDGPWIIQDGDDDPTDFDHVRSFLLNTRYWWLEGVDTATLRKGIDKILSKHDIETIAPGYGCILRGKRTVAKHMQLVDDVLKSLDKSVAVSRYVGRDEVR